MAEYPADEIVQELMNKGTKLRTVIDNHYSSNQSIYHLTEGKYITVAEVIKEIQLINIEILGIVNNSTATQENAEENKQQLRMCPSKEEPEDQFESISQQNRNIIITTLMNLIRLMNDVMKKNPINKIKATIPQQKKSQMTIFQNWNNNTTNDSKKIQN